MDPDLPKSTPRKVKFAPKAPPRRTPKAVATSTESVGEDAHDEAAQKSLARKVAENLSRKGPKAEKKPAQVTFQQGGSSSTDAIRTFGRQKERVHDRANVAKREDNVHDTQSLVKCSTPGSSADSEDSDDSTDDLNVKKKAYKEPWDYENSNYPIVLPLRPPYSGDPELLDKEEFGEPKEYDETTVNSAKELGLLPQDQSEDLRMFLYQFPFKLPLGTKPAATTADEIKAKAKGKGKATTSEEKGIASNILEKHGKKAATGKSPPEGSNWNDLPEGYMGKMLVYKSGKVKMKLGDALFDVDPASKVAFQCDAAAVDLSRGQFVELGKMEQRHAVVIPDLSFLP